MSSMALSGQEVFLPGELEWRNHASRAGAGVISDPNSVVSSLQRTGEKLGVVWPFS